MSGILLGTTLLASFLGGVVALAAPCCVSVMLPAYLATGFRHRGGVLAATLVFGAGVATVILPIGLGATVLSRLLVGQHLWIFSIGGALMIIGGVAVLAGWSPRLPMPGGRAAREGSYGSAYVLGAFSGAASACCAPVLAGVAVLAGASASFPAAIAIGFAYIAGMVTPLALIAAVWDRVGDRGATLLTDRRVTIRIGGRAHVTRVGTLVAGLLMVGMGVLSVVLAISGPGMSSGGWQAELSGWLQHASARAVSALSFLPGWAVLVVLAAVFALLILRVFRKHPGSTPEPGSAIEPEANPETCCDSERQP
jgi:cytochrome c biogenesis protein CcdA